MMRALLILLLTGWFAGPALADPIVIRSGDHGDFVRLVLPLPGRMGWTVTAEPLGHVVRFEGAPLEFDTSEVFQRISTDRIRAVTPASGQNGLHLQYRSSQKIRSFWHQHSMLVIDISDNTEPEAASTNQKIAAPLASAADLVATGLDRHIAGAPQGTGKSDADTHPDLAPLQATLEAQLRDAVIRGQLQKGSGSGQSEMEKTTAKARAEAGQSPEPAPGAAGRTVETLPFLSVQAVGDPPAVLSCPAPVAIDPMQWGTEADYAAQIGAARRAVFGEFDTVHHEAVKTLARLQVYFGFGLDAKSTLALSHSDDETRFLTQIADILDGAGGQVDDLRSVAECGEAGAFWAFLASGDADRMPAMTDKILKYFTALPLHLKLALVDRVERRFLQGGDRLSAGQIRRIVARGLGEPDQTPAAPAPTAVAKDPDSAANQMLDRLIASVDAAYADGSPLPEGYAALVGGYAVEYRGTAYEGPLLRAELLALAMAGRLDRADALLDRIVSVGDQARGRTARSDLADIIRAQLDDTAFLGVIFDRDVLAPKSLRNESRIAIARRALALGFPGVALRYLGFEPRPSTEQAVLAAQAHLKAGNPAQARASLRDQRGSEVNPLRADLALLTGSYDTARRIYQQIGDKDRAGVAAWLGLSDVSLGHLTGARARLGSEFLHPDPAPTGGSDLSSLEDLVGASQATRAVIETVLQQPLTH